MATLLRRVLFLVFALILAAEDGHARDCGDSNGDGNVDTLDARWDQRCLVGTIPADMCTGNCDVTGDGVCDTRDARLKQRIATGALGWAQVCVEVASTDDQVAGGRLYDHWCGDAPLSGARNGHQGNSSKR